MRLYKVKDLYNKDLRFVLESYKYDILDKYIEYKGNLFLVSFFNNEIDVYITISSPSDRYIFYNEKYNNTSPKTIKKILKEQIKKQN